MGCLFQQGIQLEIARGEFCVLLGPSGSGKSTLLNIIDGIDHADEGHIFINGRGGDMKNPLQKRFIRELKDEARELHRQLNCRASDLHGFAMQFLGAFMTPILLLLFELHSYFYYLWGRQSGHGHGFFTA